MCVRMCVCLSQKDALWGDQVCLQGSHWFPSVSSRARSCTLAVQVPWLPVPSPAHAHTCSESFFQQSFCSSQTSIFSFFYWSVVDLQCCVSFCCIAKWLSYRCIFFFIFFPLWFFTEYWICSLCCMVRPCLFLSPSANAKLKAFKDRSFLPIVHLPKAPA